MLRFEMLAGVQEVMNMKIAGALKKLVRNSQYSKSDEFNKFSVEA